MSKLPQLNLRIAAEHQAIVRSIAERLRERDGDSFAQRLCVFLEQADLTVAPAGPDLDSEALSKLSAVLERLDALEAWRATFGGAMKENPFTQELGPTLADPALSSLELLPDAPRRIPDDVLEEAARLRAQNYSWNSVAKQLDFEAGGDALRKAVSRRKRA